MLFAGCNNSSSTESTTATEPAITQQSEAEKSAETADESEETTINEDETQGIDYMALVNKLNPLPDYWEDAVETVHCTNSLGDDVEVEKKAYDAYLALKADLETEGIFVDLDSARRSVADQERIMAEFTETYGADYALKTVATPGYSEHHTGLALDLYLNIDGEDVYLNEDMVQYPEIWAKIHEKLADYGFILRYLEDKEHITGYGYEPWHLRYIDDVEIAKEITAKGITFEEYLGAVKSSDVTVDFGSSELFTEEELKEAAVQVKCKFATFEGCELHSLRYAGDENNNEENLAWMKELDDTGDYTEVVEFLTDFHTPMEGSEVFDADTEMTDYQWWLAREKDGGWQLLSWGY
ncbi:MAG: M15 family metallopeptidase [Oscillospiraceae bacterium]